MKRVCLLTGSSGRFGLSFMRTYAAEYDFAAVFYRNEPLIDSQTVHITDPLSVTPPLLHQAERPSVFTIRSDLRGSGEPERILDLAFARFGRVDLLVHAAVHAVWSALLPSDKALASAVEQFQLNAILPLELSVNLVRRFWRDSPHENAVHRRHILCLSSLAASTVVPDRGQSVYAASKAAFSTLARHMASEFAPINVRVNALEPDSFPSKIPLDSVVRAAYELDSSKRTGEIVTLTS